MWATRNAKGCIVWISNEIYRTTHLSKQWKHMCVLLLLKHYLEALSSTTRTTPHLRQQIILRYQRQNLHITVPKYDLCTSTECCVILQGYFALNIKFLQTNYQVNPRFYKPLTPVYIRICLSKSCTTKILNNLIACIF